MKRISLFFLVLWPLTAFGQHKTNPDTIYQSADIYLQNTDVYYYPFAPPAPTDTPWNLSSIASELRDPDGVRSYAYAPRTHGIYLYDWHPHGDTIGNEAVWMRLFTAMNKPDGTPSDIIVGDSVTTDTAAHGNGEVVVDSMEDVDFRATGDIKMEAGFHILPGAEFHAYIAPSRDSVIFSDEFNSTSLSKWIVTPGHGGNTDMGAECSSDTNVQSGVADTDALDGYALRIDLKEKPDSCYCNEQDLYSLQGKNHFGDTVPACSDDNHFPFQLDTFQFTTGIFLSCPFPFMNSDTPLTPAWQHAPYGIYEVREKIPPTKHHNNNWGDGQSDEWNLGEIYGGDMTQFHPGPTHRWTYGPYKGIFSYVDSINQFIFRSPSANFGLWNNPTHIIINNFLYEVNLKMSTSDTFIEATGTTVNEGGFPSSLTSSHDSVSFYYTKYGANEVSDALSWSIDSSGTYFTGPYAINNHGDSLYFTKSSQPTSIWIPTALHDTTLQCACHWDHNTGKVIFTPPLSSSMARSGSLPFQYATDEGPDYPVPGVPFDVSTYNKYHTFTMELYPYEARLLMDGAVVRRWPDRMIPDTDWRYQNLFPRTPMNIRIGEFDLDGGSTFTAEKADFESRYGRGGTASQWVDYFKIWDLPSDVKIPDYTH